MESKHGQALHGSFYSLFGLPATRYQKAALIALGRAMKEASPAGREQKVEAGYVYFGQFLDHDITRLRRGVEPAGDKQVPLDQLVQMRTPAMDLDALYGLGFDDAEIPLDRNTGEMMLGYCMDSDGRLIPGLDLPREEASKRPLIGDDRNDENLIVAQLHLQFLKLHNRLIGHYREAFPCKKARDWYQMARHALTLCYQEAVLYDFLPTLTDARVLQAVMLDKSHGLLYPVAAEEPRIPVEFSVAAYRFGHSMVRFRYTINDKRDKATSLQEMLQMTGKGGFGGRPYLPAEFLVDWSLFFKQADKPLPRFFNFALAMDPSVDIRLSEEDDDQINLAVLNLLRSNEVGLPHGQAVVRHLLQNHAPLAEQIGLRELTPDELNPAILRDDHGNHIGLLDEVGRHFPHHGFGHKTPLWYYLLAEADVIGKGVRLGPLGSLIVVEVFHALAIQSRPSVLFDSVPEDFPFLPRSGRFFNRPTYRIADLLKQE